MFHRNTDPCFLRKHLKRGSMGTNLDLDIFECTFETKNCMAESQVNHGVCTALVTTLFEPGWTSKNCLFSIIFAGCKDGTSYLTFGPIVNLISICLPVLGIARKATLHLLREKTYARRHNGTLSVRYGNCPYFSFCLISVNLRNQTAFATLIPWF